MTAQPHQAHQSSRRRVLGFVAGIVGLVLIVGVASNAEQFSFDTGSPPPARSVLAVEGGLGGGASGESESSTTREPIEVPQPVVVALAVSAGAGLLYVLSRQRLSLRFRKPSLQFTATNRVEVSEEEQADSIAEFARDLIDELNEGDSPRYAIQRAYAAVETGFGVTELTRKPAETPLHYLDRVFGRHKMVKEPLTTLTDLFQRARFSDQTIDEPMRRDAIDSLSNIRDYYHLIASNTARKSRSTAVSATKP